MIRKRGRGRRGGGVVPGKAGKQQVLYEKRALNIHLGNNMKILKHLSDVNIKLGGFKNTKI